MSSLMFLFWSALVLSGLKPCVFEPQLNDTIFKSDFCDVKCGDRQHTMCPVQRRKAECSNFEFHTFQRDAHFDDLLATLVNGHNGVRDRIAERMNIPNMLEITWDVKLARMAENFLHRCPSTADPCTLTHVVFDEEETINEFFKFNHSPAYIVQNTYSEEGLFYPYKFVERVIRYWYFEKDGMRPPTILSDSDNEMKRLLGENNFTHFAYPFINRFGCGLAKYDDSFHILCNYYPYYRTLTNTMYFQSGEPATNCPASFPLRDGVYDKLCTEDSSYYSDAGTITTDFLKISIVLLLLKQLQFKLITF